jgi:hypothetical protein
MTQYEAMAIKQLPEDALARFYELSGKFEHDAHNDRMTADKRAWEQVSNRREKTF